MVSSQSQNFLSSQILSQYPIIPNNTNDTNITAISFPSTFQYISFSWNIPFLFIFPVLCLRCLLLLRSERKTLNRNQKMLFSYLIELFTPNLQTAEKIYGALKGIDRAGVGWVSCVEFFLISNIAMVFVRSSWGVGAVSRIRYQLSRCVIIFFQIVLAILTLAVTLLTNILGALTAALGEAAPITHQLEVVVFVVSAAVFSFLVFFLFGILFVNGLRIMRVLKAGELRARNMSSQLAYFKDHDEENALPAQKEEPPESTSQPSSSTPKRDQLAQDKYSSGEQLKIIQMKQQALKRVFQFLIGITVSMGLQFIGVCFIPLYLINKYLGFVFYVLYNTSICSMVIIFVIIQKRVSEMQKLFDQDKKKGEVKNSLLETSKGAAARVTNNDERGKEVVKEDASVV
ncbi:hypothetical protein C9374_005945 [Naegleria lovaniensis]|uniref:Uncharacterized protein n=1 Tax=Naegleria lovaniensis TaxID=51637 RepID=A0AA88KMK4_NAELO|nr:uncharacterized protein C9374_005945 [Naegleria lovaniensis]KAG2381561.1 hypothetical protein C9374_005945 [Naegleria lovaniensis]